MAFCNSCGATLGSDAKFCNKCGATTDGSAAAVRPPAAASAPAQPKTGDSGLRTVLIIIGVIVALGVLAFASLGFFVWRVAKHAHVTQNGDNVKVETPFGTVESSKDPDQAVKDLGVDIYPGAQAERTGSTSATFAGFHTAVVQFTSADPVAKVCNFYSSNGALQPATVTASDDHCTVVCKRNNNGNVITINIDSDGTGSKFQITTVTKKAATSN
jgi:hypothetical protein